MISIRTDLAIEAKQAYTEENKREAINNLDKVNISDVINNAIKFEV